MADDKQRKPASFEDDDGFGSAADDPTAVWDAEALRQAGLDELSKVPEAAATPAVTPAMKTTGPSIVVDVVERPAQPANAPKQGAASAPKTPAPAAPARKEMSWATTVGLAAGLGAIVYAVIRFLR